MLVGGRGTRLQPLTATIPKQMLPVAEVPMIDRVLGHLAAHGVTEAVLSLGYRPDGFLRLYPEHRAGPVALTYAVEPTPLDTAGAIRFAALAAGYDDTFLVANGDVLTDLDVAALLDLHRRRGAEATIHLVTVADPSRFGLVQVGAEGRVAAFVEKPTGPVAARPPDPLNTVNAGTYVLEPTVLERIAGDRRVSVEREVFPAMVAAGTLYAHVEDAYWIDTGTPEQYIRAQLDLLDDRTRPGVAEATGTGAAVRGPDGVWRHPDARADGELVGATLVGQGAVVEAGARVERAVVGARCRVRRGARVERSVLLPGVEVGPRAVVEDSVLGPGAVVDPDARVGELTVVAEGARVGAGTSLAGARVAAG